jgi:hypothetical protein
MPVMATWQLGVADDASHALLAARRALTQGGSIALFELEDGRAPIELRRADGEPFTEIDAVVRAGSRWYVATPPSANGEWVSIVWQVDGPIARELARVPRAAMESRPIGARLARRSDGRAIGFVVDGQPSPERAGALRWVLPIDVESGALGDPEPLGAADLGDRDAINLCAEDDSGWVLDTPLNVGTRVSMGGHYFASLSSIDARVRVTPARACVERLVGTMPSLLSAEQVATLTRNVKVARMGGGIPVVAVTSAVRATQLRYPLRCTRRIP